MKEIEEGEFFDLNTEDRIDAFKLMIRELKEGTGRSKTIRDIVRKMGEEEIYKQKKDRKDFVRNCCKAENHAVEKVGRFKIALETKATVKA